MKGRIEFDWGDGHVEKVDRPDLSNWEEVVCSPACFPDGEEGTGKVVVEKASPPQSQKPNT